MTKKTLEVSDETVRELAEALRKHGGFNHYYYRPASQCYRAGFEYTLGGLLALALSFAGFGVMRWLESVLL